MPKSLLMGAIGDDLTGSVELAGLLAADPVRVSLYTDPEAIVPNDSSDAVVIAQRSRVAPVEEARAAFTRCADRLLEARARQLFFKYCAIFDSLPTGNIGPCADVLADRLGDPAALFCPAYADPDVDRTVYGGHMFVGDKLLSDSPKRYDPLTPMTELRSRQGSAGTNGATGGARSLIGRGRWPGHDQTLHAAAADRAGFATRSSIL